MQTVAIICEYNPFHMGHKVQIDAIRSEFDGASVCIIALMSGCWVQRGGAATLSPSQRAAIALEMGVDLVLELPFPWSMSGADYFARGAVSILEALGGIDYLCFGSESGDLDRLSLEAKRLCAPEYAAALDRAVSAHPTLSWAKLRECAYLEVYGEALEPYAPNDLLAIAYLSHLRTIKPLPIARKTGYSASAARRSLAEGDLETLATLVPQSTFDALNSRYSRAEKGNSADVALLSALRLMPQDELACYAEGSAELAGIIARNLPSAGTVEELVSACTNKKYTSARIRRAVWHAFLRTPADLPSTDPSYTRLLGCNAAGREWLSSVRKRAAIPVITRVSNARMMPETARQFFFAQKRSALFAFLTGNDENNLPIIK